MQLCFFSGRVIRAFLIMASLSFFVSVDLASANRHTQEDQEERKCSRHPSIGPISAITDYVDTYTDVYGTRPFILKKSIWNWALGIQREFKAKNCSQQIQRYVDKFFRAALKANEKSCSNKDSRCAEYNNWAQNLYETAVKNDDTIILEMLYKHSTYIREKQTQKLINIRKEICTNVLFGCIPSAEERAEKKKAAEDAKKKAAEEAAKKKAAEERAAAKKIKEIPLYILTGESLKKMYQNGNNEQYKLQRDINAVEIKQFKGTQIKTIMLDGQSKTISCGDTCTLYSAKKVSLQVGSDLGIPAYIHKAIMDAIVEAMGEEFVKNLSETELRKFQVAMRKLIVPHWKSLEDVVAKVMGDPNFNIASSMTKEQLKQILIQRIKTQAGSKDNSGGTSDGPDLDHEEEDWRTAPGSIYYD